MSLKSVWGCFQVVRRVQRVLVVVLLLTGTLSVGVQAQLRVDPAPVLSIGGLTDDPRYMLSEVVGGLRLSDGKIILADRFTNGLRAYAADGSYLKEVGGEGQGPGEYEYIRGMSRCSEFPIVAFDLNWDQKIYDAGLTLIEERPASIPGIAASPYNFACAPSGHWLATGWGDTRAQFREGYYVATAPVVFGHGDEVLIDFGQRLSSERIGTLRPDRSPGGSGPHPFGKTMSLAIGHDQVFLGDGKTYHIEVYDFQGSLLSPLEWDGPNRTIGRKHRRAFEIERLENTSADRAPAVRRWLDNLPELEEFPAYDRLRTDSAGNLWVRYFPRPGEKTTDWVVFAPDGTQLGQLSLPSTTSLLDIGSDYVLLLAKDELDVPTVHLHNLLRR